MVVAFGCARNDLIVTDDPGDLFIRFQTAFLFIHVRAFVLKKLLEAFRSLVLRKPGDHRIEEISFRRSAAIDEGQRSAVFDRIAKAYEFVHRGRDLPMIFLEHFNVIDDARRSSRPGHSVILSASDDQFVHPRIHEVHGGFAVLHFFVIHGGQVFEIPFSLIIEIKIGIADGENVAEQRRILTVKTRLYNIFHIEVAF